MTGPSTHWPDCWRTPEHHTCAVRRVEEARAQAERQRLKFASLLFAIFPEDPGSGRDLTEVIADTRAISPFPWEQEGHE